MPTPDYKTILVVDDSPTVRKLISGKLEKCGHEVLCSSDGVEAMEALESIKPDLILLDITMPRMDGYQVCKLIRGNEKLKDVPVVMISGKDGFFDKVRDRLHAAAGVDRQHDSDRCDRFLKRIERLRDSVFAHLEVVNRDVHRLTISR